MNPDYPIGEMWCKSPFVVSLSNHERPFDAPQEVDRRKCRAPLWGQDQGERTSWLMDNLG